MSSNPYIPCPKCHVSGSLMSRVRFVRDTVAGLLAQFPDRAEEIRRTGVDPASDKVYAVGVPELVCESCGEVFNGSGRATEEQTMTTYPSADGLPKAADLHVAVLDEEESFHDLGRQAPPQFATGAVTAVAIQAGSITGDRLADGKMTVPYPRPYVRRINTEHGSHIEPPLDQAWTDLRKLRWHAAVVEVDAGITGLEVHVARSSTVDMWDRAFYDIRSRGRSSGVGTFLEAWQYLNGIVYGADIVRDQHLADEVPM